MPRAVYINVIIIIASRCGLLLQKLLHYCRKNWQKIRLLAPPPPLLLLLLRVPVGLSMEDWGVAQDVINAAVRICAKQEAIPGQSAQCQAVRIGQTS